MKGCIILFVIMISLTALSGSSGDQDVSDCTDLELIQHINVDCSRLTKLLNGKLSAIPVYNTSIP